MYGNWSLVHIECTECNKVYLQTSANCDAISKARNAPDQTHHMVYSACDMGVGAQVAQARYMSSSLYVNLSIVTWLFPITYENVAI